MMILTRIQKSPYGLLQKLCFFKKEGGEGEGEGEEKEKQKNPKQQQ